MKGSYRGPRKNHGIFDKDSSEKLRNYKELNVWQKSYKFCLHIYKVTKHFPRDEMCGLTSRIRKSAVSKPSNIEGYGRKTTLEYVRCLYIAYGSVCELETRTMISGNLGYVGKERFIEVVFEGLEVSDLTDSPSKVG
ncbi:MAG: four helix bundle protein [Deltaproteobacteria bacterium]|nr:four helix bundle protein [Deltaproteobacteria bacterium]